LRSSHIALLPTFTKRVMLETTFLSHNADVTVLTNP